MSAKRWVPSIVIVSLAGLGSILYWLAWRGIPCQRDPLLNFPIGCYDRFAVLESTAGILLWVGSGVILLVTLLRLRLGPRLRHPAPTL